MSDSLNRQSFQIADIRAAFGLLTRLPVAVDYDSARERAAVATWAYPLVGAALGALAAFNGALAAFFGAPDGIVAALSLATLVVLSGAMHEDGLSDCADGLGGGSDKERRLEIMKDSRIGAFGATALGIALIARWSGIEGLAGAERLFWPLLAVGAASRLPMVFVMFFLPPARSDGMAAGVGLPPPASLAGATAIALILGLIAFGWGGFLLLFWVLVAPLPLVFLAKSLIDGQTGDILGGCQQLAEIAALAVAVSLTM